MLVVDAPKREKRILLSITEEQLVTLISKTERFRDKVIIYLLFDSGMRLSELASIKRDDIDWNTRTILVIGKGNKQRRAPFTQSTAKPLRAYLGIITMRIIFGG